MRVPPPRRRCADLPFKVTVRVAKDGQIELARPNRTLAVLCAPAHRTACGQSICNSCDRSARSVPPREWQPVRAATNKTGYDLPAGQGKRFLRANPKMGRRRSPSAARITLGVTA